MYSTKIGQDKSEVDSFLLIKYVNHRELGFRAVIWTRKAPPEILSPAATVCRTFIHTGTGATQISTCVSNLRPLSEYSVEWPNSSKCSKLGSGSVQQVTGEDALKWIRGIGSWMEEASRRAERQRLGSAVTAKESSINRRVLTGSMAEAAHVWRWAIRLAWQQERIKNSCEERQSFIYNRSTLRNLLVKSGFSGYSLELRCE